MKLIISLFAAAASCIPACQPERQPAEPPPACAPGWILAEDLSCVNPGYYD